MLGVVGFAGQIPTFLLSPLAGVMADRWNRQRILIIIQILAMIQAFILAILVLRGTIAVWHIVTLGVFLGCVSAFDIPTRQSFLIEMVEDKGNLGNAIALNSLMFNSARLIGPSIAGLVILLAGEGVCFLINSVSFLAVIVSLIMMNIKHLGSHKKNDNVLIELKEGFVYVKNSLPIKLILMLLSIVSLMGASYTVLMPIFAKDILGGGPSTFGFLMASAGVGAILATVYLASRKNVLGFGKIIVIASSLFAAGLIMFSISRVLWLSLLLLAMCGFGFMAHTAASNSILQTIVDDDKRGRVMSFYTMAFMGMSPIGSLVSGALAKIIGPETTLVIGGLICLIASLVFAINIPALRKAIHPIYRRIGIIPEVASGVSSALNLTVPPRD